MDYPIGGGEIDIDIINISSRPAIRVPGAYRVGNRRGPKRTRLVISQGNTLGNIENEIIAGTIGRALSRLSRSRYKQKAEQRQNCGQRHAALSDSRTIKYTHK